MPFEIRCFVSVIMRTFRAWEISFEMRCPRMPWKIQFSFKDIRQIGPDLKVTLKAKKNDLD